MSDLLILKTINIANSVSLINKFLIFCSTGGREKRMVDNFIYFSVSTIVYCIMKVFYYLLRGVFSFIDVRESTAGAK